jgi:hypothetical protein
MARSRGRNQAITKPTSSPDTMPSPKPMISSCTLMTKARINSPLASRSRSAANTRAGDGKRRVRSKRAATPQSKKKAESETARVNHERDGEPRANSRLVLGIAGTMASGSTVCSMSLSGPAIFPMVSLLGFETWTFWSRFRSMGQMPRALTPLGPSAG